MEPISGQNVPAKYSKYLKAGIASQAEAAAAASSYCTENTEADCQGLLDYFDAHGYKLVKENSKTEAPEPVAADNLNYSKWKLIVGLLGGAPFFDFFTVGYPAGAKGNTYVTEKEDHLFRLLLPGLGVRYKPSYDISLEVNSRFVVGSAFGPALSEYYTVETDSQFKYKIWHELYSRSGRTNLGLGPAMNINLFGSKSQPDFDLISQAPSLQSRIILGGKVSLETEFAETGSLSLEFMRLTNAAGKSFFGVGLYFKLFLPHKPSF